MSKAIKGILLKGNKVKLLEPAPVNGKAEVVVIFEEKSPKHNITEFKGLGKEIWKSIDARKYVDKERSLWERNF